MEKQKIAIACQGGGSQTAFTAGVLKSFFENDLHNRRHIVGFSGSSGGAVCAALSWYSLLRAAAGDPAPVYDRLVSFWEKNSAQGPVEAALNSSLVGYIELANRGLVPELRAMPDSFFGRSMRSALGALLPRREFHDFKKLLEDHIDFGELGALVKPGSPVLLIGASNVRTGECKKFNSRKGEIQVASILASAAVPSLFSAVKIGGDAYWDGLFTDNPPTDELIDPHVMGMENIPDEIWVIQINPRAVQSVPNTPEEIVDRRNEMIGNASLFQDLEKIELINRFLEIGAFSKAFRKAYHLKKPVEIRIVEMSPGMQNRLNYASKINRDRGHIGRLMEDGERQGKKLLDGVL